MDCRGTCYQILSLLLAYPDDRLYAALPSVAAAVAQWPAGRLKDGLQSTLAQMAAEDLLRLQETYTAAFDLDPAGTLNLTYHLWRDSEKRSAALAGLHQLYQDAGWETTTGELPDYLPLMLEFMVIRPEARPHDLIRTCLGCLEDLTDTVRTKAPHYAALLALLDEDLRCRGERVAAGDGAPQPPKGRRGLTSPNRRSI